jgi:hypothetical protein
MLNQEGELLDILGIAGFLNLSGNQRAKYQKVYTMISRHEIPAFRLAGRWYCRKNALLSALKFLESQGAQKPIQEIDRLQVTTSPVKKNRNTNSPIPPA